MLVTLSHVWGMLSNITVAVDAHKTLESLSTFPTTFLFPDLYFSFGSECFRKMPIQRKPQNIFYIYISVHVYMDYFDFYCTIEVMMPCLLFIIA